jgi:hypothetical protein
MGMRPLSSLLVFHCLVACALGNRPGPGDEEAWRQLSILNPGQAARVFAAGMEGPDGRESRFGEAVALLNAEPRTSSNVEEASRLFQAVRQERDDDDMGAGSAYYLARIAQLHGSTPDRASAVEGLRELIAHHPRSPYSQLAAPKLAILLLYDDVPPARWEARVREIQALIPLLRAPEARRDTRLILAGALLRFRRDHARAYPLITQCLDAGLVTRVSRINALLLQAAESARTLGRNAEALAYYRRYLAEFRRDMAADEVRRRLDALARHPVP